MPKIPFLLRNLKYNKIDQRVKDTSLNQQLVNPIIIIVDFLNIDNNDLNNIRDKISLCIVNNSSFDQVSSNKCNILSETEQENIDYSKINIITTTKTLCPMCKRTFNSLLSLRIHLLSYHSDLFIYFLKDSLILISKYYSKHNDNNTFYYSLLIYFSSNSFINFELKLNKEIKIKKKKFIGNDKIKEKEPTKKAINYKINKSLIKNFNPISNTTETNENNGIAVKVKKRLFRPKKDISIDISKKLTSNEIRNLLRRHRNKTKKCNVLIENPVKKDYYHSISGEIISDTESYVDSELELDRKYEYNREKQTIDDFTDICDQEKSFFKIWNEYIYSLNNSVLVSCTRAFDLLSGFISKYIEEISKQQLKENLGIHLITIFDNGMINKEQFNTLLQLIPN